MAVPRGSELSYYVLLLFFWANLLVFFLPELMLALGFWTVDAAGGYVMLYFVSGIFLAGVVAALLVSVCTPKFIMTGNGAQRMRATLWLGIVFLFIVVAAEIKLHIDGQLAASVGLAGLVISLFAILYWLTHPAATE